MKIGYARVSTQDQDLSLQVDEIGPVFISFGRSYLNSPGLQINIAQSHSLLKKAFIPEAKVRAIHEFFTRSPRNIL